MSVGVGVDVVIQVDVMKHCAKRHRISLKFLTFFSVLYLIITIPNWKWYKLFEINICKTIWTLTQ